MGFFRRDKPPKPGVPFDLDEITTAIGHGTYPYFPKDGRLYLVHFIVDGDEARLLWEQPATVPEAYAAHAAISKTYGRARRISQLQTSDIDGYWIFGQMTRKSSVGLMVYPPIMFGSHAKATAYDAAFRRGTLADGADDS